MGKNKQPRLDTSRVLLAQKAGMVLELKQLVTDCIKAMDDLIKRVEALEKASK